MIKTLCNLFFLCECVVCLCECMWTHMCVGVLHVLCLVVVLVCWMLYEWVLDYFLSLMWSICFICDFPYGISPLFSLNALNFLFIHINLLALNLHRIISFYSGSGYLFRFVSFVVVFEFLHSIQIVYICIAFENQNREKMAFLFLEKLKIKMNFFFDALVLFLQPTKTLILSNDFVWCCW